MVRRTISRDDARSTSEGPGARRRSDAKEAEAMINVMAACANGVFPMKPIITAFAASPDRGQGMARDMPVRWAFEEVGQPYDVRLVSFAEMKQPGHLAHQPFGQIPSYEEGDLSLFESGAIVFHIAQ